jgi:signal transduction histidine kinase
LDTKSKKFNDSKLVRVSAAALCVIACAVMAAGWMNAWNAYRNVDDAGGRFLDLFGAGGYEDSRGFRDAQTGYIQSLLFILESPREASYEPAIAIARETIADPDPGSVAAPEIVEPANDSAGSSASAGTASGSAAGPDAEPAEAARAAPPETPPLKTLSDAELEERSRDLQDRENALYKRLNALDQEILFAEEKLNAADGLAQPALQEELFALRAERYDLEIQINALNNAHVQLHEEINRRIARKELEGIQGFGFYIGDGESTLSNRPTAAGAAGLAKAFKSEAAWLAYEDGVLSSLPRIPQRYAGMERNIKTMLMLRPSSAGSEAAAITLYLSFDENFMAARTLALRDARDKVLPWALTFLAGFVCALALLIYLLATTGRRDESGRVKLCALDRVFTELQLGLAIAALSLGAFELLTSQGGYVFGYRVGMDSAQDLLTVSILTAPLATVGLWCLLSLTRNLKARRFFKNTLIWLICRLIYRLCKRISGGIRPILDRKNPMAKTVLIALAVCLLSATVVLAPVVFALILVFGPSRVKKYAAIKRGVEEVKSGNVSWQIPVDADAHGEFDELARGINEISDAADRAMQSELKNRRLKTDLISNVSHDLKTPLTSVIAYIDLLKREGPDGPSAREYLDVLDQKSQRLKKLTEDLFEAAKASSGAIPVHTERIDLLSLIRQGLGEMNEGFAAQGLDVKLRAEGEKYCVRADGQLLWRIVENLLGNVQKYALEGSRVYIDLSERYPFAGSGHEYPFAGDPPAAGGRTVLEIKNISKAQLNISAEELTERFVRGDESRATSGSGLGLAIAEDLTRLQNGCFEIKIDGDLFKVVLTLERWEEAAA